MESFSDVQHTANPSRLHKVALYSLLVTLFLTPLVFVTSPALTLDVAKALIIGLGTLVSAVSYSLILLKEKRLTALPASIFYTGLLILVSLIISAFTSIHAGKSLIGQGNDMVTLSFIGLLFVAAWLTFELVRRNVRNAFTFLAVLASSFAVVAIIQIIHLFAPGFTLGFLTTPTSSILGKWFDLSIWGMVMVLIAVAAKISNIQLSKMVSRLVTVLGVVGLIFAIFINQASTWLAATIVFGLLAVVLYIYYPKSERSGFTSRLSYLAAGLFVISLVLTLWGAKIAGPVIIKTNTAFSDGSVLPWQLTLDVAAGSFKSYPLFGVGPSHFTQAFNAYKPSAFNLSDFWTASFAYGFGLIPTIIISTGLVGLVLWVLLLVFLAIVFIKGYKRLSTDPVIRFYYMASSLSAIFLWIMNLIYVPSQATVFATFVLTGLALAMAVKQGTAVAHEFVPSAKVKQSLAPGILVALTIVFIIWGLVIVKKGIAMAYFSSGVKTATAGNFDAAESRFRSALSFDKSDVYWQAISAASLQKASRILSTATSSNADLLLTVKNTITTGIDASKSAIAYDKTNYYNYVSLAQIEQVASAIKLDKAYEDTVKAFTEAISSNPLNPATYVALAQFQAQNSKYDDALQTLGAALQVKSNYIDAVYLVSQIQIAKGNLNEAAQATQVALQYAPGNPTLHFQLGLLAYNAKNYTIAQQSFSKAVELQNNYQNAKYYLGLSEARLGNTAKALAQFDDLQKLNPDNTDVKTVLTALKSGRSPFTAAQNAIK